MDKSEARKKAHAAISKGINFLLVKRGQQPLDYQFSKHMKPIVFMELLFEIERELGVTLDVGMEEAPTIKALVRYVTKAMTMKKTMRRLPAGTREVETPDGRIIKLKKKAAPKTPVRVGFWRSKAEPDLPKPQELASAWKGKNEFLRCLLKVEEVASHKAYKGKSTCRICGVANGHVEYTARGFVWPVGLAHYVTKHNVMPPPEFIDAIINGKDDKRPVAAKAASKPKDVETRKPSADDVIEAVQTYTQALVRAMTNANGRKAEHHANTARAELYKRLDSLGLAQHIDWTS